jgi:hypothetical protein
MKKAIIKITGVLFSISLFLSCDVLRGEPFEVSAWTPGTGIKNEDIMGVALYFSQNADEASVEHSFSFTEDGEKIKGAFIWNDKCLTYHPASPLQNNKDYIISLGTDAKSTGGLSLEEKFSGSFSTRKDSEHPLVNSIFPGDESIIYDTWSKVYIQFSMPVDLLSCINDISFSPNINGSWHLEDDNLKAVFEPGEQWTIGMTYKINITSLLKSAGGKILGHGRTVRWTVGDDKSPPELLETTAINSNGENVYRLTGYDSKTAVPFSNIAENASWEADYRLKLTFNKDVDMNKIQNFITIEPALKYELNPSCGYSDTVIINFTEKPEWKSRFNVKIDPGIFDISGNKSLDSFIYKIYANGEDSMPPELIAVRLSEYPRDSFSTEYAFFVKENIFELFNIDVAEFEVETWIELYFDTAAGADIDMFSVMDLFKVTATNNAISFLPLRVTDNDFTITEAAAGYTNNKRVEVRGLLSNNVNKGIVTFSIGKGLLDTKQNKNTGEMKIAVIK